MLYTGPESSSESETLPETRGTLSYSFLETEMKRRRDWKQFFVQTCNVEKISLHVLNYEKIHISIPMVMMISLSHVLQIRQIFPGFGHYCS